MSDRIADLAQPDPSRRRSLRWGLALVTSALASCTRSFVPGNIDGSTPTDATPDVTPSDGAEVYPDPSHVLNAMLATEFRAIAAYSAGIGIITSAPTTDPLITLGPTLAEVASSFQNQHRDHAEVLSETIRILGGTPLLSSSVQFLAPDTFTPTITNVLKLAANAEKAAALLYSGVPGLLATAAVRAIPGSILGVDAQHFMVLYALLTGVAAAGPEISTMTNLVVPTAVLSGVLGVPGLETVPRFVYT